MFRTITRVYEKPEHGFQVSQNEYADEGWPGELSVRATALQGAIATLISEFEVETGAKVCSVIFADNGMSFPVSPWARQTVRLRIESGRVSWMGKSVELPHRTTETLYGTPIATGSTEGQSEMGT